MAGIIYLMFSSGIPVQGGILYNHTSYAIKVSSDSYTDTLPPGKNSRIHGIRDVDALIIDRPMVFRGKTLKKKVLKFCDLAVLELTENKEGEIIIKDKDFSWICRLANDFNVYNSVKEAFGQ